MVYSLDIQCKKAVSQMTETLQVGFQGERGAFGEEAVQAYFEPWIRKNGEKLFISVPYHSFADVFYAVAVGEVNYGLVPIENSQVGGINDVYDLLLQYSLFVTGEIRLRVDHCLLALQEQNLSDISRVISHPQALAQCDVYLRELGVEIVASYNTAGSAKMVYEEHLTEVAAVASAKAAELYHLKILAREIQTIKDNYTRFIILGSEPATRQEGPAKTMLIMAITAQCGSLHACLGALAKHGVNLLKIESRPSHQRLWEYIFYLDFEGHQEEPLVRKALAELARCSIFCKALGSFAKTGTATLTGEGVQSDLVLV